LTKDLKDAILEYASGAVRLKREAGGNPAPARGCDRGRKPHKATGSPKASGKAW